MNPAALLWEWLQPRLAPDARAWLAESAAAVSAPGATGVLLRAFSLVVRRIPRAPLALGNDEWLAARTARPGWDPREWTVDQAARLYLLLAMHAPADVMVRRIEQLHLTADLSEAVTLYRGLPLYADPARHALRAAEGVRSSMKPLFEAVALCNPYPSEVFDEGAWNQMVLKALFVGSRLALIIGLDARANRSLADMLVDYAHERWAAKRPVSPELWRCVGPFAEGAVLDDLARVLATGQPAERQAAALSLNGARCPQAADLLHRHAELARAVRSGLFDWQSIAQAM